MEVPNIALKIERRVDSTEKEMSQSPSLKGKHLRFYIIKPLLVIHKDLFQMISQQ